MVSSTTCRPSPTNHRHLRHAVDVMVPFLVMIAFIAIVAGSTVSLWHAFRIPWLLVAVIAFFVWHRVGRHHHRRN